jgi:hypothetical protein
VSGSGFASARGPGQGDDFARIGGNAVYQSIQSLLEIGFAGGGEGLQRGFVTVKGEFNGFHGSSSFTMESI